MKITFLADSNHPNTLIWANYLSSNLKHDVSIISFNKPQDMIENIQFYHIKSFFFNKFKIKYIAHLLQLRKLLKSINPDILIGYRVTSYGFLASLTGFHPLIVAAQGQSIPYPASSKIKRLAAKHAIRKADLLHAWADHMAKNLIDLGAKRSKILIVPKGIDISIFNHDESKDLEFDRHVLVSTRSLKKEYKIDLLIYAIKKLIERECHNKIKLIIAGDGSQKNELIQLAKKLYLNDHIDFKGKVMYSDLPNIYRSANIYISTVPTDGASASLFEAMSCGCFPIVVDNEANRKWIVNGINGFLYNEGNINHLADCIDRAISNSELRKSAKFINRKKIDTYANISLNMNKFEKAYFSLIDK